MQCILLDWSRVKQSMVQSSVVWALPNFASWRKGIVCSSSYYSRSTWEFGTWIWSVSEWHGFANTNFGVGTYEKQEESYQVVQVSVWFAVLVSSCFGVLD